MSTREIVTRGFILGLSMLCCMQTPGCVDGAKRHTDSDPWTSADPYSGQRNRMVRTTIAARDIVDARVLAAMRSVPRHLFVDARYRSQAYADRPLPIGYQQTISQPYIVALMSQALELDLEGQERPKVLEIGTGSGYQAAVLEAMGAEVYSIEIVDELAQSARQLLERLGYENVHVRSGDGYQGWPEQAPFDAIVVTAAPPEIPEALKQQLREGANLVIPVGDHTQELIRLTKRGDLFEQESVAPVRFVPMTGAARER